MRQDLSEARLETGAQVSLSKHGGPGGPQVLTLMALSTTGGAFAPSTFTATAIHDGRCIRPVYLHSDYLPTQSQASYHSVSSSPSVRRPSSVFDGVNEEATVRANAAGSCLLRYQHRLRIWGSRHGQNGFGEKRGRVRLSRLICPKVVSGMVRESGKRKSAEVFRKSVKVRESNEPKSAESSGKSIMIVAPAEDVLQSSRVAISVYVSISSCVGICFTLTNRKTYAW